MHYELSQQLDDISFFFSFKVEETKIQKAINVKDQLKDSIDWLSYMLFKETDEAERKQLTIEISDATRQYEQTKLQIERYTSKGS